MARALYVQPGIAGSRPQGEATRRGPPGERQDLPEGEFGGASGAGWRAPVVPLQRRAQGALEGDAKKAPPAAAPPGSSSRAESGGGAPGAKSDEAAHEGQRLRVPAATDLAGKNEELLRASSCKLRVPTAFAPLSPAERDSIRVSGPWEGGTVARQGGDEGGIAAPRFPMWRGAMHDQVGGRRGNVGRVGARKPLLRDDAALSANCLAGNAHPRVLQDMRAAGESAAAGASRTVVAQEVEWLPASGSAVAATAGTRQWQRQAKPATERAVHEVGRERGPRL